jgi:hypothetical protein
MSIQERTIVNEDEEEAKKQPKKILGIFPGRSKSRVTSGTTTPNSNTPRPSVSSPSQPYDDDDDDLPPREEEGDLGSQRMNGLGAASTDSLAEEAEVKAICKTAGFDFKAISKELGKDIDVNTLKQPAEPATRSSIPSLPSAPLERSGSAPPPQAIQVTIQPPAESAIPSMTRSASYVPPPQRFSEENDGDISGNASPATMSGMDMPLWGRQSSISPPLSSSITIPNFGWGSSASSSTLSLRAAPPARPHPPELTVTPFASAGMSGVDPWGSKKEEDLATTNPW